MSTSNHPIHEFSPIRPPLVMMDKTLKWKHNKIELAPNCPRCASTNTKFCYYNNYSVSQPRYFCKACRRYWTKGGSLRNVPIGGGCRKSRRGRATRQDSPPPSLESTNGSESGGDIDMAAVFAKYANQNAGNYEPSSSFASSEKEDNTILECGKALVNDQVKQVHEIDGQDFVYQNFDVFEVEGILGTSEIWSEGTNLQSFGSQQPLMVHSLQEFDQVFSSDDQLRMSGNFATDNWGSFDLPSYEDF